MSQLISSPEVRDMSKTIILHVDMNSYFATMEQQAHPNLRGKPIGVAGKTKGERTVITAASVEAKKFGLKSGMSAWEARRLCPDLIIVPANYDRYIFTSKLIFDLLERFSPKVDIFSIDEAFLELSPKFEYRSTKQIRNLNFENSKLVSNLMLRASNFIFKHPLPPSTAILMSLGRKLADRS